MLLSLFIPIAEPYFEVTATSPGVVDSLGDVTVASGGSRLYLKISDAEALRDGLDRVLRELEEAADLARVAALEEATYAAPDEPDFDEAP